MLPEVRVGLVDLDELHLQRLLLRVGAGEVVHGGARVGRLQLVGGEGGQALADLGGGVLRGAVVADHVQHGHGAVVLGRGVSCVSSVTDLLYRRVQPCNL